jgi:hypothetical protein
MNAYDRQRMFAVLLTLAIALFVSGNLPLAPRRRRQIAISAIAAFALALVAALVEIALWLGGFDS